MKIIKNFLIAFFVLLMSNNAFSQNNIVNDADFSPPNSALQNGNILVQPHNTQESITLALNLVRWAGSESKQLEAEGYFILAIYANELILSDVVTFSNSDFSPSYAIISQPKFIPITFKANLVKIGAVKFKYREKTNGAWTAYRYSSKNFNTAYDMPPVVTPVTEITGPDNLCTEATYTITNPGTISLENAAGIATLTALGNNQWQVTNNGLGGDVTLKSTNGSKSYTKKIRVGAYAKIVYNGGNSMPGGANAEIYADDVTGGTYTWSVVGGVIVSGKYSQNVIVKPNANPSNKVSNNFSVSLTYTNSCGTSYLNASYTIPPNSGTEIDYGE